MTTERSSFDDPGTDATMDDALGGVDRVTATRDVELESTGLSDAPFPEGAGTTRATGGTDWAGGTGSTGSSSSTGSGDRLQEAAGGVVERVADTAQQKVGTQVNGQLGRGADMLDQVSRAIRQSGETLRTEQPQIASLADTAAEQVDKATQFLRQNDFSGLVREAEGFARRQPAVFLGGALALGIVASRFLKASPSGGTGARGLSAGYRGSYGSGSAGSAAYGGYGRGFTDSGSYGRPGSGLPTTGEGVERGGIQE